MLFLGFLGFLKQIMAGMMGSVAKVFSVLLVYFLLLACSGKGIETTNDTVLSGNATIFVEESLMPLTEDVVAVFESQYKAKLALVARSETEIVQSLLKGKATIAVLPRSLDKMEINALKTKKVFPRITPFGTDAIALIQKNTAKDSLISKEELVALLQGKEHAAIKGLVFDNLNSGAASYLLALAGLSAFPEERIYSFTSNEEVIKYVAENEGVVGIVGNNWLLQPSENMVSYLKKINVLKLKGAAGYYGPSQNNIAQGNYLLARDLHVVNCQSYQGLGIGFASFIAGERGQRIVLKAGLLPVRMPSRKIITRSTIQKKIDE